jgi:hypothetical protein
MSRQPIEALPPREWHVALARLLLWPLPDAWAMRINHWLYFRRWPDYEHPRTLQEHIQAYLLRSRDPALVMLADKVAVRPYIDRVAGPGHTVPLLGVWRRAEDVPLDTLPYPLVLKPSHLSGRTLILRQPPCDAAALRRCLRGWLRRDHSRVNREWFYALVPPGIVAEPLLQDDDGGVPPDVKAYVIGGKVRYFQVECGRFDHHTRNLYSPAWELLPARSPMPRHAPQPRPRALTRLIALAEALAEPFEFLRVDFYVLGDRIFVGELTNSPGAGFGRFYPEKFGEEIVADWVPGRRGDTALLPATALPGASVHPLAKPMAAPHGPPGTLA